MEKIGRKCGVLVAAEVHFQHGKHTGYEIILLLSVNIQKIHQLEEFLRDIFKKIRYKVEKFRGKYRILKIKAGERRTTTH